MKTHTHSDDFNVADFAMVFEELTRIIIRLPSSEKLSFTTLSVLHTLSLKSPMRLTELAANEQITQPAITQLVSRLERDGMVERHSDPGDGRVVLVHITEQGVQIINSRRLERIAHLSKFFEGLTPEDKTAIQHAIPSLRHLVEIGNRTNV
jgi:DNA-binding MarR family transcriptional regulator